jgi:hypothetical protein
LHGVVMKLVMKIVLSLVLPAVLYTDIFAYSDTELIAIRSAFDGRRDSMLNLQVTNPFPSDTDPSTFVWSKQDFALAALYLNTQTADANQAILDACAALKNSQTFGDDFHWYGNLFFRIYKYFGHDSAYFPGRLTSEAESAICDIFWEWAKTESKVTDAETAVSKTWYIWGSENHDAMKDTTCYSAAAILKDVAPYNTYVYDDGFTAQQHYEAWNVFAKEYLRERAKRGLLVETGSYTYSKYTLQGWYNFYDFAEDTNLARLGGMTLDLWWADWAHEQINGVRGGGKSRVYQDGDDLASSDGVYGMCWYYLGIGSANNKHPGVMCLATSTYRLPLVVMDIALDISGRGAYEFKSRRPGLNLLPRPVDAPASLPDWPVYCLDPNYGGIFHYTYSTPAFIIGSSMLEKRPTGDWSAISSQNRWQGVILKKHVDARIFPRCVGLAGGNKTYNQYWSVQNKGTLITQKLSTSSYTGDMRVYFAKNPMRFASIVEESGWIFVNATDAYAAVRPATGTYSWDDANWVRLSDPCAPVIIEVAQSEDYADFTAFKTAVKALPLSVANGVLTYTGLGDNGTFTFYTGSSQLPKINGQTVDLQPSFTFDSPFMREDLASGNVTIHKGGRTYRMDFNNAVSGIYDCGQWGYFEGDLNKDCLVDISDVEIIADNWLCFDNWLGEINPIPSFDPGPFADDSTTVALWHMDAIYVGLNNIKRVADDDSLNPTRDNNLRLGSNASGYSVTTQPTKKTLGFNGLGACLLFDGVNDECVSDISWMGYTSVLVDAWFNTTTTSNTQVIVEASSTWSLSLNSGKLNFTTYHSDGSTDILSFSTAVTTNAWHHVQGIVTADGKKYLTLDGTTLTASSLPSLIIQTKSITMGNKPYQTKFFSGYIDEVRIATIDPQGYRSGLVNLRDFAVIAEDWLKCTNPADSACEMGL